MKPKKDLRRANRAPIRIPVIVSTDPQGTQIRGHGVVTDLSRRGLGFETEAPVKDGELLFLKISRTLLRLNSRQLHFFQLLI